MEKFLVFDLDGTLLGKKSKIHKLNVKAIDIARKQGWSIIIATGRQPASTEIIAKKIGSHLNDEYLVSFNGGTLWKINNNGTKKIYFEKKINKDIAIKIFDYAIKNNLNIFAYHGVDEFVASNKKSIIGKIMAKNLSRKLISYSGELFFDIDKFITWGGSKKEIEKLIDFSRDFDLEIFDFSHIAKTRNIEICPSGVDKVFALKEIAKLEKRNKDDFIYFGDGSNDIESIKWVGHGVAMKNSSINIKKHSNACTEKNNKQAGVGHYIIKNILNKGKNV